MVTVTGRIVDAVRRPVPPFVVVVPARPGPLLAVGSERPRDDIDLALDDVFGAPDDRGPGVADAVLVAGGGGVVIAGAIGSWPPIAIVAGAAAAALGLILPVRSLWHRASVRRRDGARLARRADGALLRVGDDTVADLVARHDQVREAAAGLPVGDRLRVEAVAHAAVREVASLLGGRDPSGVAEVEYAAARVAALRSLAEAAAAPGAARAADVAARREVEAIGGSSIADASALVDELGGDAHG